MKRCPECRRDYYDETLLYCLDDGNALLEGPASADELKTAILSDPEALTIPTDESLRSWNEKGGSGGYRGERGASKSNARPARHYRPYVIVATVLFLIAGGVGLYRYTPFGGSKTGEISLANARVTKLTTSGKASGVAISPDGKYVVHVQDDGGQQSLFIRQIATQSNVQIVPPAVVQFGMLKFSADGTYVYYSVLGPEFPRAALFKVPALGGQSQRIKEDINHTQFSFSPDGNRFVFTRNINDSTYQMLVVNADGTGEEKLMETESPNLLDSVAWSPDGERIVYEEWNLSAGSRLFELRLADGSKRQITDKAWCCGMGNLTWTSNNELILRASDQQGSSQIWRVVVPSGEAIQLTHDPDGFASFSVAADANILAVVKSAAHARIWVGPANDPETARPITSGSGKADNSPVWFPDGRLLFSSSLGERSAIWSMNADGSNLRRITPDAEISNNPVISPDGATVAYGFGPGVGQHVWLMKADGSDARQITRGEGYVWQRPDSFSLDGRVLFYSDLGSTNTSALKIATDGTGEAVSISRKRSFGTVVSPDGKLIAYRYLDDEEAPLRIAIAPIDGGEPLNTFSGCVICSSLRWSPDGRSLVYAEIAPNGVGNLIEQPITGGKPKQLTDFKSDLIFAFAYSGDGKQIALSRGTNTSDVLLYTGLK